MDAFEQIAARLFEVQGYWTRIGYAVELTKEQKRALGKPSLPRPQLDVIAFKPTLNELLIVECKSYLDSYGVNVDHFHGREDAEKDVYKMFNRKTYREMVISTLVAQLQHEGLLMQSSPTVRLILVAGNIYSDSEPKLQSLFAKNGWTLVGPKEVVAGLRAFAKRGYENDLVTFVTKLLEFNPVAVLPLATSSRSAIGSKPALPEGLSKSK